MARQIEQGPRWASRRRGPAGTGKRLGADIDKFMRYQVAKRQRRLTEVAQIWRELLPEELLEHTCLEDIRSGRLRVMVDSAAHLAELELLVREGLLEEMRNLYPRIGLTGIKLLRGQWYRQDADGSQIAEYKGQSHRRTKTKRPERNQNYF